MMESNGPAQTSLAIASTGPGGTRDRLETLTTIRLFAALHVVLFHFSGAVFQFSTVLVNIINTGYYAVTMFYVLSGFVLVYSGSDAAGNIYRTRCEFWVARIARIYPAYLLAFVLCIPHTLAFAIHSYPGYTGLIKGGIAGASYLLMVQSWFPRLASWWNFPGWSVSVEVFFYLCFPFLLLPVSRLKSRQCYTLISICWTLSLLVYLVLYRLDPWWSVALNYNPFLRLPGFVTGMAMGRIFLLRPVAKKRSMGWLIGASVLCLLAIGASLLLPLSTLRDTILVPAFAFLVYSCAADRSRVAAALSWGPLVLLGDASYSTYILQWPVFSLCGFSVLSMTAWKLMTFVVILLAASVLSFRAIESPLRRAIMSNPCTLRVMKSSGLRFQAPRVAGTATSA
jgi:peptidoglycan/LPS O-acetylase OafA/YrhL